MKIKIVIFAITLAILPPLLLWLPFFLRIPQLWGIPIAKGGMAVVASNYDGPLYIVVAKSLYEGDIIKSFAFNLPVEYYAAHFPLYPLIVRFISPLLGYPYAMLGVTLASSVATFIFFYLFIRQYVDKNEAFFLTAAFSVFPARFLIVRSVGSPEPLFMAVIIASIYFFQQKKYLWAGLFGALAVITKSPGILLFIAYIIVFASTFINRFVLSVKPIRQVKISPIFIFLIPLALIGVFYLYQNKYHNFFAYFNSGDNIHLFFPPFQIFNYSQPWVQTHWLEEIIFVYLIGVLSILRLSKLKDKVPFVFTLVFFITTIFVSHRDLVRYSLPIVPFIYAAFAEILTKKEFKFALIFILIPIYLFSLAFISQNQMSIGDWSPLL